MAVKAKARSKSPKKSRKPSRRPVVRLAAIRLASKAHKLSVAERELLRALGDASGPMLPRPSVAVKEIAPARSRKGAGGRRVAARYDAAQTTDENRRHWANADALSASAANSPGVRQILRNRARHEVSNNCYARGIVLTLANDMVGRGPRLQMLGKDSETNRLVESYWRSWARRVRLAQKLRTMRMARCMDGEAFAMFVNNPKFEGVKLDLRLIEADQFTSLGKDTLLPYAVDGIVFDEDGNPTTYHMLKTHPGDNKGAMYEIREIAPEQVIHWFRCDRPGQLRGIPEIMPALPLFAQLRRYTLAVLTAAESAAEHSGIVHTESPPDDSDVPIVSSTDFETIETERGMFTFMPNGWDISQLKAEQPTTTHGEFVHEIVAEIGRSVNMPLIVSLLQAKDYNMASGRLDLQTYFKDLEVVRDDCEIVTLDPLFDQWIKEAAPVYNLNLSAGTEHAWLWTGREHVDPAKEAAATVSRRSSWTSSLADECAVQGADWQPKVDQIVEEAHYAWKRLQLIDPTVSFSDTLQALGLSSSKAASGRAPGTPNSATVGDDGDGKE